MTMYDVAIVGGGPAGLAAAEQTLAAGLSTCIIDEQQRPGGQILRQPPAGFAVAGWLDGAPYRKARALLDRVATDPQLHWRGGRAVLGIAAGVADGAFDLTLSAVGVAGGIEQIQARRVLVAGGCYDIPVALPGWTLPGVMSAGAVQTLVKAQQVLPGQRVVLFGSHPLMIVLAQQIIAAGGTVEAVCFAQPFATMARIAARHMPRAVRTPAPLTAALAGLGALRRAGVPVRYAMRATRCEGSPQGLERVVFDTPHGEQALACDLAAMCYGFLPQSDLVRQARAAVRWSAPAGGWEAVHDAAMRASVPGLYVAGETTGVAGSDAAMAEGALAGIAMAGDAGALDAAQANTAARGPAAARAAMQGFIDLLRAVADPAPWLPDTASDTLLCRCEDVTAGMVEATIAEAARTGTTFGASAIKLRCRAGMGLCQGRGCEHAIVRRIAAARGCSEQAVEGFRPRFPARAVAIADLLDSCE